MMPSRNAATKKSAKHAESGVNQGTTYFGLLTPRAFNRQKSDVLFSLYGSSRLWLMTAYHYIFSGVVYPERAYLELGTPISLEYQNASFGIVGTSDLTSYKNQVTVDFTTRNWAVRRSCQACTSV